MTKPDISFGIGVGLNALIYISVFHQHRNRRADAKGCREFYILFKTA